MNDITPAQPRAEGAVIAWRKSLQPGVDYRDDDSDPWRTVTASDVHLWATRDYDVLVEARPPRPRMVTIEVSEADARKFSSYEGGDYSGYCSALDRIGNSLAAALDELEAEQ